MKRRQQQQQQRERVPHYMCDHKLRICGDCDGSAPATNPWRTYVTVIKDDQ